MRADNLGHILAWTALASLPAPETENGRPTQVDLVELPRLKLSFSARKDAEGVERLYSLDYSDLFISNRRDHRTTTLMKGLPHSLLLANNNGEAQILVPALKPCRVPISSAPFSTELVFQRSDNSWNSSQDTPYDLFPVHVSLRYPQLSSQLLKKRGGESAGGRGMWWLGERGLGWSTRVANPTRF